MSRFPLYTLLNDSHGLTTTGGGRTMDGAHCACAGFRRVERLRPFDVVHAKRQEVIAKDDVETEDVYQQQP